MSSGNTPKILIVDDKDANIRALHQLIKDLDLNLDVISTTNPIEALRLSLNHEFFLALLDVQMPQMDGYELSELLRAQKRTADLPIILVSAVYNSQTHIFKGYQAGAVDYISKPIHGQLLYNKIQTFLSLYQRRQAIQQAKESAEQALLANQQRDEALFSSQEKSRFLANMSHEIRTPLNATKDSRIPANHSSQCAAFVNAH